MQACWLTNTKHYLLWQMNCRPARAAVEAELLHYCIRAHSQVTRQSDRQTCMHTRTFVGIFITWVFAHNRTFVILLIILWSTKTSLQLSHACRSHIGSMPNLQNCTLMQCNARRNVRHIHWLYCIVLHMQTSDIVGGINPCMQILCVKPCTLGETLQEHNYMPFSSALLVYSVLCVHR